MSIVFDDTPTYELDVTNLSPNTMNTVIDFSPTFFTEQHPLYGWRDVSWHVNNLFIQLRLGNGQSSGNSYTLTDTFYNNGKVSVADLFAWISSFGSLENCRSYNFYAIPLYDPYTDEIKQYLVSGIQFNGYSPPNLISIKAWLAPVLADNPDLNAATSIEPLLDVNPAFSGGLNISDNRFFSTECYLLKDDKLRGVGVPQDIDSFAIYFAYRNRTSEYDTPATLSLSTDAAGWTPSNEYIISCYNMRERNYGIPKVISNISPEVGPESEPGGYDPDRPGNMDDSSDTIGLPSDPTVGVSSTGFVRVYNIGSNALVGFGIELFPPLTYTAPTAITAQDSTEALINGFNSLVTFMANIPSFFDQIMANTLINYVIDCHIIPVSPGSGTSERIKVGYKEMLSYGGRLYQDYVNVPCGSINIGEYYGAFADFLTTAKLYLPFVGFVPLRPEHFIGDTLKVDYKFNIIDGSFTAYVRSGGKYVNNGNTDGTIIGQYAGNACIHVPITGVTYSSMVSGLVGAGGGMAAGAASGNLGAVATSALAAANARGDIAQSNAYNGSAAFLGCRTPFLLIERPVSSWARNYQHEIGIPANIYSTLSDVSGFVQMTNVHVDGISRATDQEKEEIRKLLASGVIV